MSAMVGSDSNSIRNIDADHNFIGGGWHNIEDNPSYGVIAGGWQNYLGNDSWAATIAGGDSNRILAVGGFIGGGWRNLIQQYDDWSVLGGGESNQVLSHHSFLGGGDSNLLWASTFGTLGGGLGNTSKSVLGVLGGGVHNQIDWNSDTSVLGGGAWNYIGSGRLSTLGGGLKDSVLSPFSFLGGGRINLIDINSPYCVIGGGDSNAILHTPRFRTDPPTPEVDPSYSVIAGGSNDTIRGPYDVISGGFHNFTAGLYGSIGGGDSNIIDKYAFGATIPGGIGLEAVGYTQLVAGRYNTLGGYSGPDDPLVIIGNGTGPGVLQRSNAATISNRGYLSVFGQASSGGAQLPAPSGGTRPARIGTSYADNNIVAWGNIAPGMFVTSTLADVGVASIAHVAGSGTYVISLNVTNPDGSPYTFVANSCSIVATLNPGPAGPAGFIMVTPITGAGTFTVTTLTPGLAASDNYGFMFHAILR